MPSAVEESQKPLMDNLQERRAQAIAAKAQEIEKVHVLLFATVCCDAAQLHYLAVRLVQGSYIMKITKWLISDFTSGFFISS